MSDYQIVFPLAVGWPRLANQMFQYAVSQLLALRTNSKVVLDKNRLNSGMFSFQKYFKNLDFVTEYNQSILQNNCKRIKETKEFELIDEIHNMTSLNTNIILEGWFQNSEYFIGKEDYIKHLFEFNDDIIKESDNYINTIKTNYPNKQIVSLHLRRPDNKNDKSFIYTVYYKHHIQDLLNKFDKNNTVFLIFTSDIQDVQEKLIDCFDEYNFQVVNKDEAISMCIMSKCDHNIIGASSYSWWAAYLNKNVNKRVIIPSPWFSPISTQHTNYVNGLYLKDWEVYEMKDYMKDLFSQSP
jgi:hypothetical protein